MPSDSDKAYTENKSLYLTLGHFNLHKSNTGELHMHTGLCPRHTLLLGTAWGQSLPCVVYQTLCRAHGLRPTCLRVQRLQPHHEMVCWKCSATFLTHIWGKLLTSLCDETFTLAMLLHKISCFYKRIMTREARVTQAEKTASAPSTVSSGAATLPSHTAQR